MVAELRIGIIGLGARSAIAANLARTGLGARLVGGADPDPQMRARAARAFGEHLAWVEDTDQLLAAGIDAAIVTSPDDTHEAITCALLEAGAAVYLEKPIAITIEGADRVLETAYRTGTPLYVGHNMRHMAVVRTLRDVIRQGTIGQVKAIWCRHFVGNGGDYYFKDWHADRSRTTGLLLQKAAHDIDVMNWLSDSVPARASSCRTGSPSTTGPLSPSPASTPRSTWRTCRCCSCARSRGPWSPTSSATSRPTTGGTTR